MTEHTQATLTDAILRTWPFSLNGQPRYVVGVQVRDGAGFQAWRTLDAVIFDTWPSKGLELHGLEIKTSVADLRRELNDPKKFGQFEPMLDRFSIVAPLGMVDLEILPKTWGLYCPTDDGTLRARRRPLPLRPGKPPPDTADRSFMAAFVRAVVDRSTSPEALRAEYNRGHKHGEDAIRHELQRAEAQAEHLQQAVKEFQETSGVEITTYNAGKIGEAVKLVMGGGIQQRLSWSTNVRDLGNRLLKLADELDVLSAAFGESPK